MANHDNNNNMPPGGAQGQRHHQPFNNPVYTRRINSELKNMDMLLFDGQVSKITSLNHGRIAWHVKISPDYKKFNGDTFKVAMEFPVKYPFRPPTMNFLNRIKHPNVDNVGKVHLDILQNQTWNSNIMASEIILALMNALENPEKNHIVDHEATKEIEEIGEPADQDQDMNEDEEDGWEEM